MNIQILGAHNIESKDSRCNCILVDGVLALDAGTLASSLTLDEQRQLAAILITHHHFDHIRDIPALGINYYLFDSTIDIYSTQTVLDTVSTYMLNDILYPDYTTKPPEKPSVRFHVLEPGNEITIAGYMVLPLPVHHAVPAVGFYITSKEGKKMFYTSDTGPRLADVWKAIRPDLLIIESTSLNKYHDFAIQSGHLTPALLQRELESFREINNYLPKIVLIHMNPIDEDGIKKEISEVEKSLKTKIAFGYEGMAIRL